MNPTFCRHHWLWRDGVGWHRTIAQLGSRHQPCAVGDHRTHVSEPDRSRHRHCGSGCRVVLDDPQTIVDFNYRCGDCCRSGATALCQRHRPHPRLGNGGCVWSRNSGGSHQSDRGGIVSALSGEPDRHHCHQPCGFFAHSAAVGAIFWSGWDCSGC